MIMKNAFSNHKVQTRYDLKGSTYKRTAFKNGKKTSSILKDLDWIRNKMRINVGQEVTDKLKAIVKEDAEFLARCNIIDYSLLVGIADVEQNSPTTSYDSSSQQNSEFSKPILSTDGNQTYTLTIIDTLTPFTIAKRCESIYKACTMPGSSCVAPRMYASRFVDFIHKCLM